MKRKGPRGLTPDERRLWDKVAQRATPLHTTTRMPENVEQTARVTTTLTFTIPDFQIGERPIPGRPVAASPRRAVQMDKKTHGHMTRGKLKPELRLDLHGLTLSQAHPRLIGFISDAYVQGKRLVLVITGKGKDRDDGGPIPTPRGILRHNVPLWLKSPPLNNIVLEVTEAHIRHGGGGACYVYLRRRR